jgi:hypothetical protein
VPPRWPLWTALVPLVAGIALWALLWSGYRRAFAAELEAALPGHAVAVSGFPYRLEARIAPLSVAREDVALAGTIAARELRVNRVPWQRDRQVLNLTDSVAEVRLKPLAGAWARVSADHAQASLRLEGRRIARLSMLWEAPAIATGLLPVPARAARFEAHVRETPATARGAEPRNPRLPTQVQLVLAADALRLGNGDPLDLAMQTELTAGRPVSSLAGWARDGTAEVVALRLADPTGEVARLEATVVPDGAGRLRAAGTIGTVCPANVRAALLGAPPVSERRTRRPERVAFEAMLPGAIRVDARDPARPPAPVRGQEPPCPRLR